nr:serine hydrolase domain-containing protein [Sphingomicrobium sp. B8]
MANIEVTDTALSFDLPQVGGRYEGEWQEGRWVGAWKQGGVSLPLTLERGAPDVEATGPVVPDSWDLPDDDAVAERLAATVGDQDGVVGAVALVEDGEARFILSDGLDADRRFEIGSVTKVFTALLLADMVLDGTVGLNDPIGDHIDGIDDAAVAAITLRQLSNHHSGLPRLPANLMPFAQLPDPYASYDEEMLLHWIRNVEPARAPDEAYEYSNGAVGLLGYILGKRAGSDFKTALLERIVRPMGLADTDFEIDERSVAGHNPQGEASPWTFQTLAAAGALRSTIGDMARFAYTLAEPGETWSRHVDLITADPKSVQGGLNIGLGVLTPDHQGRRAVPQWRDGRVQELDVGRSRHGSRGGRADQQQYCRSGPARLVAHRGHGAAAVRAAMRQKLA